jgi:hypothetical protein
MTLSRRDEKFIHRTGVLVVAAVAMGIAVTMLKESHEIGKLVEDSIFRDITLLFTPLAALAATGYGLANKSFSSGSLKSEALALLGCYCFFLAVAVPSFFKKISNSGNDCQIWQIFCSDDVLARDHRFTVAFTMLGLALILVSMVWAGIVKRGHSSK